MLHAQHQHRAGDVDAVHVTITYHENFRETVLQIEKWNRFFEQFPGLIFQGKTAADLKLARETGRTAIFFGSQNPSCIEDGYRVGRNPAHTWIAVYAAHLQ